MLKIDLLKGDRNSCDHDHADNGDSHEHKAPADESSEHADHDHDDGSESEDDFNETNALTRLAKSALSPLDSMRFNNKAYIHDSQILRRELAGVAEGLSEIMNEIMEFLHDCDE